MEITEVLLYAGIAAYPLLWVAERIWPAAPLAALSKWDAIGLVGITAFMLIALHLPAWLPAAWLEVSLFKLAGWPLWSQVVAGHLLTTLLGYGWHRSVHAVPVLWRSFHQIHHSPDRLDVSTSYIFHPSEAVVYVLLAVFAAVTVLGLDPVAASMVGFIGSFNTVFQHANLRTPAWLTWFVQRPEAHSVHHQYGVHAHNYGDWPVWDKLFGTFRLDGNDGRRVGFDAPRSRRLGAMLLLRDVHRDA
ncbi:MAG TPA: sterol desaturase family protein [Burkholderiaceae bacterium]